QLNVNVSLRSLYANVSVKRWPTSVGVAPVPQSMRVSVTSAGDCANAGRATRTLAHTPTTNRDRDRALSMVSSQGAWNAVHIAGLARYGSMRSIFTLRRVRADS